MDLRLDMHTLGPAGSRRGSIDVKRPEGFSDAAYLQHTVCAAELLRQAMNGEVDYRHKARDGSTTTMLIADEHTTEEQLETAFRTETSRHHVDPGTWGDAHVVLLVTNS